MKPNATIYVKDHRDNAVHEIPARVRTRKGKPLPGPLDTFGALLWQLRDDGELTYNGSRKLRNLGLPCDPIPERFCRGGAPTAGDLSASLALKPGRCKSVDAGDRCALLEGHWGMHADRKERYLLRPSKARRWS